jgi:hypothetical protein
MERHDRSLLGQPMLMLPSYDVRRMWNELGIPGLHR